MKESQLERAIVRYCKDRGLLCYKFSSPAHRGVPDRLILGPGGNVLFLELKAPGKRPTALQEREIRRLCEQGFRSLCVDNFEMAQTFINRYLL